jgi:signal transduction histidine kinase
MKIRTKLTLFFTVILFIVVLVLSVWYQYRLYFTLRQESIRKLDNFSDSFFRPGPMDKPKPGPFIPEKKPVPFEMKPNLNLLLNKLSDSFKRDHFSEILSKRIWLSFYDMNLNVLEQSAFAKNFPIGNLERIINKKYFNINLKANPDFFRTDKIETIPDFLLENEFYTDKENFTFNCIGKTAKLSFDGKDYYLIVLLPDNKNTDYLNNSLMNVFLSLFIFTVIIIMLGLWYSRYSLNPINKIINDLNRITEKNLSERINYKKDDNDEISEISLSINNLLERIETAFNMEKQFISDVSHEFKTPIAILQLNLENIAGNPQLSDDEIDKISSSLEILYTLDFLIKKLLYLSRLESNLCRFNPQLFNVKKLFDTIISNIQSIAELKGLFIKLDIEDDSIEINGDNELLYIAFYNIIENAIKYTSDGLVTVSVKKTYEGLLISVEDTGIGIPKDKIGKIFDKFYRVDQSRNDSNSFGIGLTITKRILDFHKARIKIDSIVGEKTIFEMIFN